jgi:hypothetical protein
VSKWTYPHPLLLRLATRIVFTVTTPRSKYVVWSGKDNSESVRSLRAFLSSTFAKEKIVDLDWVSPSCEER